MESISKSIFKYLVGHKAPRIAAHFLLGEMLEFFNESNDFRVLDHLKEQSRRVTFR